ncbi:MAG TPA: GNAT family N-acetyltransferase [Reyranella sp.]|nr:GNAT family N-acetyltransferase [Reyranella sp.]
MTALQIRDAVAPDAEAACVVILRSIAELCAEDHRDDPKILAHWLANKRPDIVRGWMTQAGNSVLVAIEGDSLVAVGSVTDAGEITLNYVSPDARFRGVSRALLAALERRAAERGNAECTLASTATARRFYLANGYVETGVPRGNFGTQSGFPMRKALK